jgi:hypothetical protein
MTEPVPWKPGALRILAGMPARRSEPAAAHAAQAIATLLVDLPSLSLIDHRLAESGCNAEDSGMLGFELGFWDYATFLTLALLVVAGVTFFVWLAGLPGRIAISRNHPEAEAVKLLGWAGLLPTIYPWVQAFIWAFKPTDVIDIRRFPREEASATNVEIARLSGHGPAASSPSSPEATRPTPDPD